MNIKAGDAGIYTDSTGKTARATVVKARGGNLCDVEARGLPRSETQHVPVEHTRGESPRCFVRDTYEYREPALTVVDNEVRLAPPRRPSPWAANRATVLAVVLGALATGLSLAGLLFR